MRARNDTSCKGKDIQAEKLEALVLESIATYILSDNAIKTILDRVSKRVKDKSNTSEKEIKKLEKAAEKLDARIENMLDLYYDGKLSKSSLNKRTEWLEKELDSVHMELEQLRKLNSTNVDIAALREFLFKYRTNLHTEDPETKKALIDAFVHSVEITNDKITLTLKVDDTLDKSDRFMLMSNGAVMPFHIYEKSIAESFKNISKHKGDHASS